MANIRGTYNRCRRGIAAMEFALTLPVWITLLLGASDGAYCLIVNEKADRIAYTVTDIVTQHQTISVANLNDIALASSQLMQPIVFSNSGLIIVTSVYKAPGANPTICWQYTNGAIAGAVSQPTSRIGQSNGAAACTNGSLATLPNGLTLNDNDNVVLTEVFFKFTPLFLNSNLFSGGALFPGGDIYRVAVYKPRLSPLITPPV